MNNRENGDQTPILFDNAEVRAQCDLLLIASGSMPPRVYSYTQWLNAYKLTHKEEWHVCPACKGQNIPCRCGGLGCVKVSTYKEYKRLILTTQRRLLKHLLYNGRF